MDFINGNTMAGIADYVITADNPEISPRIGAVDIIYCKTDFIPGLFNYLKEINHKKYTLITGMSDKAITKSRIKTKPDCVNRWFAVNAVTEHPQLFPIPLGIENHMGFSKGKFTGHTWLAENVDRLHTRQKDDVIYCNFNTATNPKQRGNIVSVLKAKGFIVYEYDRLPYKDYCELMSECKYVLCPPGNGVDTHRLWEALYLGCVPITLKSRVYQSYSLPIIQVGNWEDLTVEMLAINRKYDYPELYSWYWEGIIKNNGK